MKEYFIKTFKGEALLKLLSLLPFLIVTPYLTRTFTVEEFGVYLYVLSLVSVLSTFITFGFVDHVARNYPLVSKEEKNRMLTSFFIVTPIGAIVFYIALSANNVLNIDDVFLPIILLLSVSGVCWHFFNAIAHQNLWFRDVYFLKSFYSILLSIVTILGVYFYADVFNVFYAITLFSIAWCIFVIRYFWSKFSFVKINLKYILSMGRLSVFSMTLGVSWALLINVDRYFILEYMDTKSLGIYGVASLLSIMSVTFIFSLFSGLLKGLLYKAMNAKVEIQQAEISKLYIFIFSIFILPVMLGFVFYGGPFVVLYAGEQYSESHTLVFALSFATYITSFANVYMERVLFSDVHKIRLICLVNVLAIGLNVFLNMLWIPTYGLMAAAIATSISHGFIGIYFIVLCFKHHGHFVDWKTITLLYSIAIVVWGLGSIFWSPSYSIVYVLGFSIVTMLIYWLAVYVIMRDFVTKVFKVVGSE